MIRRLRNEWCTIELIDNDDWFAYLCWIVHPDKTVNSQISVWNWISKIGSLITALNIHTLNSWFFDKTTLQAYTYKEYVSFTSIGFLLLMVFDTLTKSLKGVSTTLSDTVSDGFDTITSPLLAVTQSLSSVWAMQGFVDASKRDLYIHRYLQQVPLLEHTLDTLKLHTTKKAILIDTLKNYTSITYDHRSSWKHQQNLLLKQMRSAIQEWSILKWDEKNSALISSKSLTIPKWLMTRVLTEFEEFVMECEQMLREIDTHEIHLELDVQARSHDETLKLIHDISHSTNRKAFGVISDHARLHTLAHALTKSARKIDGLRELQDVAFDWEASRYTPQIATHQKTLTQSVRGEWVDQIQTVTQDYHQISESIGQLWSARNTVVAATSETHSQLELSTEKSYATLRQVLTQQQKKRKLISKKILATTKQYKSDTNALDTLVHAKPDHIADEWNHWHDETLEHNSQLHALWDTIGATYVSQWVWLDAYHTLWSQNTNQYKTTIKSSLPIGTLYSSQLKIILDLTKRLIKELRTTKATLETYATEHPSIQSAIKKLKGLIIVCQGQITMLKEETARIKQSLQLVKQHIKEAKTYHESLTSWYHFAHQESMKWLALWVWKIYADQNTITQQRISSTTTISENKKMNLPTGATYMPIRKAIATYTKKIESDVSARLQEAQWFDKRFGTERYTSDTILPAVVSILT